jgi:hypothetical protein
VEQTAANFTLINNPAYPGTTTWKVYSNPAGDGVPSGVTAAQSAAILTLTHTGGLPPGTYYVAATISNAIESARLPLTVGAPPTVNPTVSGTNGTVGKTSVNQTGVNFTLSNNPAYPSGTAWKVYTSADGATEAGNIAGNNHTATLTLSSPGEIPPGNYWVTATAAGGALPSQRLKLTVLPPAPLATVTSVTMNTASQASVDFTLTNSPPFPDNSSWKVYSAATGGTAVAGITAANSGAALTLTKSAGFTPGTYYIAAHDAAGALESAARLQLTVITAATAKPVDIAGSKAKDTLTQSTVVFASGTHPTTEWKVYSAETGGAP